MNSEWVSLKTILKDLEETRGRSLFKGRGLFYKDTLKQRALSKQAVIQHLKVLVEEDWIERSHLKYFVKHFLNDDGLSLYGKCFETFGPSLALRRNSPGERELSPHWNVEEFILEFSQRIGRYITYIFMEALRQQRALKPLQIRSQIASDFVHQSIPLDSFLAFFRDTVPREREDIKGLWELGPNTYNRINAAYRKDYPESANITEKEASEFIDISLENFSPDELGNNCEHVWRRIYIAKKGEYNTCKKCPAIVKASAIK